MISLYPFASLTFSKYISLLYIYFFNNCNKTMIYLIRIYLNEA